MASDQVRNEGGYCCNFVQNPPRLPEFRCPICSLVPRDPHLTTCCGRNACKTCLPRAANNAEGTPCPLCGRRLSAVKNRSLNNEVEALEAYCCFKDRGCNWKGKLDGYDKHASACDYSRIQCQYNCGASVQRRCYEEHLQQTCTRYPLPCPTCGKDIERRNHKAHTRTQCPLTTVTCPFSEVGCKVTLQRKELRSHFTSAFQHHLVLVKSRSETLKSESLKRKRELVASEGKRLKEREDEVVKLHELLRETQLKSNTLQKLVGETEQEVRHLKLEQRRSRERFGADIGGRDTEIQRLKQSIRQLQEQMKSKCYGPPLPRFAVVRSRPAPPERVTYIPPLTMRITEFAKRKWNNEIWNSPPFYTHKYGYKMCLIVYTNGTDRLRGVWVSAYVSLVKGEYDDHLKWPYHGKVTLGVNNYARNAMHVSHTVVFDSDSDLGAGKRVTDGYLAATRLGVHQFLIQRSLDPVVPFSSQRYLNKDCLEIRISTARV